MNKADFSFSNIIKNFNDFWTKAQFGQNPEDVRAIRRKALKLRKPTWFLIPNSDNPLSVIECKSVLTKNYNGFKTICYNIAYEVGYRSRLLRNIIQI